MVNTPNEEDFNQAIQRILTEEYMDAFDDLTVLFKPLEQRKEMIDRIEGRLKNAESIKEKMVRKGIGLEQLREEILDIIGFRIIIP